VVRQVHPQQNRQSCLTTGWMQPIGPNGHQNSPVSCHRQPCGVTEDDIEQFTRFEEGKQKAKQKPSMAQGPEQIPTGC